MTPPSINNPMGAPGQRVKVITLSSFLLRLIWSCVLPLMVLSLFLAVEHVYTRKKFGDHTASDRIHNVATAIDRQIGAQIAALQMLAASPLVDDPSRWNELYDEAQGFRQSFDGHVVMVDSSMQMIFNTRVPFGAPLPKLPRPRGHAAASSVLETGRPAVGDMFFGPIAKEPAVAVAVPVTRTGRTRFLLLGIIETRRLQARIDEMALPPGWSLTVLDGTNEVMAHRGPAEMEHRPVTEEITGRWLVRSAVSPWSVVLDIPPKTYRAPTVTTAAILASIVLVGTLLSIMAGRLASRRLSNSLAALVEHSAAPAARTVIAEVESVRRILAETETARRAAESTLRENEDKFRYIFDHLIIAKSIILPSGQLQGNKAFREMLGYSEEKFPDLKWQEITHPDDVESSQRIFDSLLSGEKDSERFVQRYLHRDGVVWAEVRIALRRDERGRPLHFISTVKNITERKEAEDALSRSEEKYRTLFESMSEGFVLHEIITDDRGRPYDFRFLEINPACERLTGLPREEMIGRSIRETADEQQWIERYGRVALTGVPEHFRDYSPTLKRWFEGFAFRPAPGRCAAVFTDITERKQTEEALNYSKTLLETLIRTIPDLVWLKDPQGTYLACNSRFEAFFGAEEKDIVGKTDHDFVDKELADAFQKHDRLALAKGKPVKNEEEVTFASDGHREILETIKMPIHMDDDQLVGVLGIGRDITERKHAEVELLDREQLLNEMGSIARIGGWEHDLITHKATWTRETFNIVEIESGPVPGPDEHLDYYPPEDRAILEQAYNRAVKTGKQFDLELRCTTAKGRHIWARAIGRPEFKDGTCAKIKGTFQDITELKRMEARLRQAEKMESIGNLAGGVAHDYNNMLSIIIGNAEQAMEKVDAGDPVHADLREILTAAQRSTDITRQLLAFASQQTIAPTVLDLNDTVKSMIKMLRRLIGEDIDLVWSPEPELWPLKIDPSQIDQILANLCINARDAIAGVGKVTIETHNAGFDDAYCADHPGFVPGAYVSLVVSDDGGGIAPESRDKIFEPFFTTKGLGKGTGLGLATVYGIVKQNNGFIDVYSEPEEGTTIKIYLPRYTGPNVEAGRARAEKLRTSRGETVLIVEDDGSILKLGKVMLESLGYTVLAASTPGEAVALAETYAGRIHLLITDVVMPEMNGRELSEQLLRSCPHLKVLFMSGYTADVIAHRGVLEEGVHFIPKPFSKNDLAVKVRDTLDSARP